MSNDHPRFANEAETFTSSVLLKSDTADFAALARAQNFGADERHLIAHR